MAEVVQVLHGSHTKENCSVWRKAFPEKMHCVEQVVVTSYNGMQLVAFTGINVVTSNAIGYSQAYSARATRNR